MRDVQSCKKHTYTHTHAQRRTFYSQHHGDDEAAHPQQVIHRHKPGVCNMKKGVDWTPSDGWMDGWMDRWTDGDSHTERRSRAFCSSPGSHAFSFDAGLSLRPIPARTQSSGRTERSLSFSCCSLALHSIGSPLSASCVRRRRCTHCALPHSHSL